MRNNKARAWILCLLGLVLFAAGAEYSLAQRMRERGTDTLRSTRSDAPDRENRDDRGGKESDRSDTDWNYRQHDDGEVRIEVKSSDGDSTTRVIVHSRHYRSSGDSTSIVRVGENILVDAGQIIDGDVVAIGGKITVRGVVRGDAVSVGGSVELEGDGAVEGDAVAVGGTVKRPSGTRIGGENVGLRFIPSFVFGAWPMRDHAPTIFFTLMKLVFLLLVGWLVLVLAETRVRGMGRYVEDHLWKSLFTGLAVFILFPAAFILLLITIVGIPLALLSPLALTVASIVGYMVVAVAVGLRLVGGSGLERGVWIKAMVAGLLLFEGIPLLGQLARAVDGPVRHFGMILIVFGYAAIFIASAIGLGSVVLTRFGYRKEIGTAPPPAPTPPVTTQPYPA